MVPLKPPSTTGGRTMNLQGSVTFWPPPSLPPSVVTFPPSPPPPPPGFTTGKRDTSPLHVQPETAGDRGGDHQEGQRPAGHRGCLHERRHGHVRPAGTPRAFRPGIIGRAPGSVDTLEALRRWRSRGTPIFRHPQLFRCRETQHRVARDRQVLGHGREARLALRLPEPVELGGGHEHPAPRGDEVGQCADVVLAGPDLGVHDGDDTPQRGPPLEIGGDHPLPARALGAGHLREAVAREVGEAHGRARCSSAPAARRRS